MRGLERSSLVFWGTWGFVALPGVARAASLNLFPDLRITAVNVIVFLALVYPTNRLVLQPLLKVLRERVAAVEGTAARASDIRGEAAAQRGELDERLAAAQAEAQSHRAEIMAEAETEEKDLTNAARRDGAAIIDEVRVALVEELASARAALEGEARSLAQEAAAKILGRAL